MSYFNYLVNLIDGENYICLLKELHKEHFFPLLDLDNNRVSEVKDILRGSVPSSPKTEYVSIFEILVLLAKKYEDFASRFGEPDHTATWFWCFIVNVGLNIYDDGYFKENKEQAILKIKQWVSIFNNRTYGRDGTGSPFPLKNPPKDMRKTELFYQLCWYYNENH